MKVRNMVSSSGNFVANQFIIKDEKGVYMQSYDSMIVFKPKNGGPIQLGEDWNYSRTTAKYRNMFLGCDTAELKRMIKDGRAVINEAL